MPLVYALYALGCFIGYPFPINDSFFFTDQKEKKKKLDIDLLSFLKPAQLHFCRLKLSCPNLFLEK